MKKLLIILVLMIFISISAVSATDNLTDTAIANSDDVVCSEPQVDCDSIAISNETIIGENDDGNGNGENVLGDEKLASPDESDINIKGENLYWYIKANPTYRFKVSDSNGSGVAVKDVSLTLNGVTKFVSTDENGNGMLLITGLKAGKYTITGKYGNKTFTNTISLFPSRVIATKDISTTYGKKVKYSVRIVENNGNPIVGKKVKFTVRNKVYYRVTDSNGRASMALNFKAGKYIIKYSVSGFSGKHKYTVKNFIKLYILKWGLKGDVSKSYLIKKHMPNSIWVKKAVAATKEGIPLIKIKGAKGKVVFMTAGVHGNELNSQVAAMKMIKYLTTHPIKGTVYIIPFVNVKAISQKVRLTDYDFNRVAHRSNTVSNNIIKLILRYKCNAYGDFHTTVSPGVPGINVVLGYTSPSKCVSLSNYIARHANVNKIFYYPGQTYRWSLADYCNYKGTPAVICEVISPVNYVYSGGTSLSYKQMTCFLKYNSII